MIREDLIEGIIKKLLDRVLPKSHAPGRPAIGLEAFAQDNLSYKAGLKRIESKKRKELAARVAKRLRSKKAGVI